MAENLRDSSSNVEEASLEVEELLSFCKACKSSSTKMSGPVALRKHMEDPDRSISMEC